MSIINNAVRLGSFVAIPSRANLCLLFRLYNSIAAGWSKCLPNQQRSRYFHCSAKTAQFLSLLLMQSKALGDSARVPQDRAKPLSILSQLPPVCEKNKLRPTTGNILRQTTFFLSFFSFLFLNCFFRPAGVSPTRRPKIKLRRLRTF